MRFLLLHAQLGVLRGGGENFSRHLFTALARRGHEVSAAFVADPSGRYLVAMPPGVQPIPLPGWWSRQPGQKMLSAIAHYLQPWETSSRLMGRVMDSLQWRGVRWHNRRFQNKVLKEFAHRWEEFDVVFVHGNVGLAVETTRFRPTVLRLPGPSNPEKAPLLRQISLVCAHGDALTRVQSFLGDGIVELPIGLDGGMFTPDGRTARSGLGWTDEHVVVGYVGRLTRLKGVDIFAEAIHQVASEFPQARFLFIGHGEQESHVRHTLTREIAAGQVQLVAGIDNADLPPFYRAMDAFVLPSRYENFSHALIEAAACGVPFIASNSGGNKMFEGIGAGDLFDPESPADLARRLRCFLKDPKPLRARALECSRAVRERYSWEASADRLEKILQSHFNLAGSVQDERRVAHLERRLS